MSTTITPTLLPTPMSLFSISRKFLVPSSISSEISRRSSSTPRPLTAKCNSENGEEIETSLKLKDALFSMVDEQVGELLSKDENKSLLDGLEKASLRVEIARRQLAEIEKQEAEARRFSDYISQLESRAAEIAECQREILEARLMVEEAERALSLNDEGNGSLDEESKVIDRDEERLESIKAASVSALVGTLAKLPISFTQVTTTSQLILPLAITFVGCALFGITFRYTIRRDLDNIQLKTGTSAAFGIVKGLAMVDGGSPLELTAESLWGIASNGAVCVSENLYIFVCASVALDYCFKMRYLSPFPIKR